MALTTPFQLANDSELRLLLAMSAPPRAGKITADNAGTYTVQIADGDNATVEAWPLNGAAYTVGNVVYVLQAENAPDSGVIIGRKGSITALDLGKIEPAGGTLTVIGNVGIGASAPEARLQIEDGSGGEQIRIQRGTGLVRIVQPSNVDTLYIYNNDSSAKMAWIGATGRLGIGTIAPVAPLEVAGNMFSTGALGWYYSKTGVAHNTATDIAAITLSAGTNSSFLVAINLAGTGRVASAVFNVSTAWSTENVVQTSAALVSYTALTLTAAMNATTRVLTLTVTQTNAGSEAATVYITIQPLIIGALATHTAAFAGL